jgi:hypothetical protein
VLRIALNKLKEWEGKGVTDIRVTAIGSKGLGFMQRLGAKVVSNVTHLGDTPHLDKMIGPVKVMLDAFQAGELDAVYIAYTRFLNTMKQEPVLEQLLPLSGEQLRQTEHGWDYIYEPDAKRRHRRAAGALRRGTGVPVGGREHGLRAERADGRHEGRLRQRRQRDQRAAAGLQQDPPGGDHQGNFGDRRRRGGRLTNLLFGEIR